MLENKQIVIAESKTTPLRIRVDYTDKHITRGTVLRGDAFNRIGDVNYWSTSTLNIITDEHKVKTDPIVNQVVESFQNRSRIGIKKYGTTLAENNTDDFYQHLSEELMDSLLYLQKLKSQSKEMSEMEMIESLLAKGYIISKEC
jgi:hypothetical protein